MMVSREVAAVVIYADILVIVNVVVDYFLLLAAAHMAGRTVSGRRLIFGAVVGGFTALTVFLPKQNFLVDCAIRFAALLLMAFAAFGYHSIRVFARACGITALVTCGYGGLMAAVWQIFRPRGMAVIGHVVYFDLSPLVLIAATVATYLLFTALTFLLKRHSPHADRCEVTVSAGERHVTKTALIDTGNALEDVMGGAKVLVADRAVAEELFGDLDEEKGDLQRRYRLLPCETVTGNGLLEGYRCDRAVIREGKRTVALEKPVLAIAATRMEQDCPIILNPCIFSGEE